jgi:hypothetical protein
MHCEFSKLVLRPSSIRAFLCGAGYAGLCLQSAAVTARPSVFIRLAVFK